MRKMFYLLAMMFVILAGCSDQKNPNPVKPGNEEQPAIPEEPVEPPSPPVFTADPSNFHFIADWLNDTQILYVEKENGLYKVNYFDVETGEKGLIYEDESFIIDVLVHPSGEFFLVHTSENPNSAVVKVVGLDGTVQHHVEIDSTELAIEWNRANPEKILFTAFHEDWSFDLFAFDGHDDSLSIVELDDPFPKWAGENRIMSMLFQEHPLDGAKVQISQMETGETETTNIGNVVYFDVFEDSFVAVQSIDTDSFTYTIRGIDGTVVSSWKMPAVSNYSEWVVPTIEWLDEKRLIIKGAEKSGQLDEMGAGFNLYLFEEGEPKLIFKGLDASPLKCSPSGKYCLSGYTLDKLINVDAREQYKWVELEN